MDEMEKLKIGYDAAVKMINYEGALIWSAFRTILAANAVLLAVGGLAIKEFPDAKRIATVIAVAGVVICIIWFLILIRQFAYYRYWFLGEKR